MKDKFISPESPPEGLDRELLEILIEECAEVQQRATKMLRFGVNEVQPGQPLSNAARLSLEFGDLLEVAERCKDRRLISHQQVAVGREAKSQQLAKYLQNDTPDAPQ